MQPGVHPNGLFWTTEIPHGAFRISRRGRRARLRLRSQPLVDTIAIGRQLGLSSIADIDVTWRASAAPVDRGFGRSVPPEDPGAFEGHFADADATGKAFAKRVGFSFEANRITRLAPGATASPPT